MAQTKNLADALRRASFRGVPFQVEATEVGAGRRTQVHEYPQRDKPYVEDLGRATRDLSFQGFVVGDDYVEQANNLLGALEEWGPGTLVHPWFGTLQVSLKEPARVSFDAALGLARIALAFVESGDLAFPAAQDSTQVASRIAADGIELAAVESFADRFSVQGLQDFVAEFANGNLGDLLGIVSSSEIGQLLGYANSLAATVSAVIALVSHPRSLGWKIVGAFGLSGIATTVASWSSIVRSISRVAFSDKMRAPTPSVVYTPSRRQADQNAAAVHALGRQALLAQAIGASSLVGSRLDSPMVGVTRGGVVTAESSRRPMVSYADMIAVRDEVLAAIDQESMTATDPVYSALQAARHNVWKDLTTRARENARLTTLTPLEVTPALVLAYDYYEDAFRDLEIVARNSIRHPGFVPAQPIRVLTR